MKQTLFQSQGATPVLGALVLSANGPVAVANGLSTVILAANASRRRVIIQNTTGVVVNINFGAAATGTTLSILNNTQFIMDVGADNYIWQGTIEAFQTSGAPVNVTVLEFV